MDFRKYQLTELQGNLSRIMGRAFGSCTDLEGPGFDSPWGL